MNTAIQTIASMTEAFREHCEDGGVDFLEYLKPWHMIDALEAINEAANGSYTPEAALGQIREALGELVAIAVVGHRESLEWEGMKETGAGGNCAKNPPAPSTLLGSA